MLGRHFICLIAVMTTVIWGLSSSIIFAKPRPTPLQCFGSGFETYGHALVIWPNLGHALQKKDRKALNLLASQDTVELGHIMDIYKDRAPRREIVDIKIDPGHTQDGFKNLMAFLKTNKFKGSVPLKAAAVLEKQTDPLTKTDLTDVVSFLNGADAQTFKPHILSKWTGQIGEDDDDTAFFQIEANGRTIVVSIGFHDGTQDCLTVGLKSQRVILPENIDPRIIPENYLFNLPIAPPFDITYFYGPRIFNSMIPSIVMQRNHPQKPVSLVRGSKKSLEYVNKYWQSHAGVDFGVPAGTTVYAPYDGYVFAMGQMGCSGNTMVIAHTLSGSDHLVFSVYEHLQTSAKSYGKVVVHGDEVLRPFRQGEKLHSGESSRSLEVGDPVYQGAVIAHSGASGQKIGFAHGFKEGCVDGAHLHFEIRVPQEDSAAKAKQLTSEYKANHRYDMGKRFRFLEFETTAVNPADFIYGVDAACQTRKNLEIQNAIALKHVNKKAVPPITAGLCSVKFEKSLKEVPTIYRLSRERNDEIPLQARRPASKKL